MPTLRLYDFPEQARDEARRRTAKDLRKLGITQQQIGWLAFKSLEMQVRQRHYNDELMRLLSLENDNTIDIIEYLICQ